MTRPEDVAVVGMACRLPRARNLAELWERVRAGDDCVSRLPERPGEVGARGVLEDADRFDAALFGFSARDAAALDPQHRVFLELCWHALEDAGVDASRTAAAIALYAGCAPSPAAADGGGSLADEYQQMLSNAPDFLATRVSHRLDLKGESIVVQTGCSSSLVAVHLAVQSVISGQSDMALAGGVSITPDQRFGYRHQEGMIASPDGSCRPFDRAAAGTVPGSGAGVVVLKALSDALRDGDRVYSVVRGSALNNDGRAKASFMAPSVAGQAEAIATALAVADVPPASVGLLEAHGTATALGDQVEVEALKRAFAGVAPGSAALGSLKGAFGHLDRAAGIAGLIKASLALWHRTIPPSVGSVDPHPELELEDSAFRLVQGAEPWQRADGPRRAGVSSFGVGGTNAHVVLEEPPAALPVAARRRAGPCVVTLSARTQGSLDAMREALARRIEDAPQLSLDAVARTANLGRIELERRCAAIGRDGASVAAHLREAAVTGQAASPRLVFLFQGHGARFPRAGRDLYARSDAYRATVDECAALLAPIIERDVRELMHEPAVDGPEPFDAMGLAQPAMFTLELALARMWMSWGLVPDALVGHSLGEVVAATVAGVFELEDALRFVVERGRLLDASGDGAMLSVMLPEAELLGLMPGTLDLAAVNAPSLCVVSGDRPAIEAFAGELERRDISARRLRIRAGAHSRRTEPHLETLRTTLERCSMRPPSMRVVSALTGEVAGDELARPEHWVRHFRRPVRFMAALGAATTPGAVLLEIGVGQVLTQLAEQQPLQSSLAVASLGGEDEVSDVLGVAARAWCRGLPIDWGVVQGTDGERAALPLYAFDHSRRWPARRVDPGAGPDAAERSQEPAAWLYEHRWSREPLPVAPLAPKPDGGAAAAPPPDEGAAAPPPAVAPDKRAATTPPPDERAAARHCVVVGEAAPLAGDLAAELERAGVRVTRVADARELGPEALASATDIVDLAPTEAGDERACEAAAVDLDAAFWKPLALLRRVASLGAGRELHLWSVSAGLHPLDGEGDPAASPVVGLERVAAQEHPWLRWTSVDLPARPGPTIARAFAEELLAAPEDARVALREDGRWLERLRPAWPAPLPRGLRPEGTYLVTGGLGRVGLELAYAIAATARRPRIVLCGRSASRHDAPERVAELRELGAEVEIAAVDVCDAPALERLVEALVERHGRLDGVVHAAGFTDRARFPLLLDARPELVDEILAAKVRGTVALSAALGDRDVDFVMLCSSLSTTFGGLRYGPYVAANAFLDAYAARRHAAGDERWISVCWEAWQQSDGPRGEGMLDRLALDGGEGREVFLRALAVAGPIVTVSTMAPDARRRHNDDALRSAADLPEGPGGDDVPLELDVLVRRIVAGAIGEAPDDDEDDLRDLGADSLVLLQVTGLLGRRLGVSLQLSAVFRSPSVRSLVEACEAARTNHGDDRAALPALRAAPTTAAHYPLTTLQRRWLAMAEEDFGAIDVAVRFSGDVDVARLRAALELVVRRHDALRTRFASHPEGRRALVEPDAGTVRIATAGEHPLTPGELTDVLRRHAAEPFDFERRVPLDLLLVPEDERSVLLAMHVHHVLFDGTSSSIFLQDLAHAYEHGRLAPARYQYADFARWQREYMASAAFERTRERWRRHFDGADGPLRVPGDRDPVPGDVIGHRVAHRLDVDEVARVRATARRADVTPFAVLTTAYLLLLAEITGEDDLVIGTTAAGRPVPEANEIVGVFVNPLPVRFEVHPDQSSGPLLSSVRDRLVEFHQQQAYWLEDLVQHVDPFVGYAQNDTFRAYILLQNYRRPAPVAGR